MRGSPSSKTNKFVRYFLGFGFVIFSMISASCLSKPASNQRYRGDPYRTEFKPLLWEACSSRQESGGKVREVRNRKSAHLAFRLGAALLPKIQLLLLRFYRTSDSMLFGFGRVYKKSRLLRIAFLLAAVPLVSLLCATIYVSYNRTDLPNLDAFIRFEPPSSGHIYDANGHVLIELGRERREIIQYSSIPDVLRQAILSAEDENFFSHSGVDYSVFPRLLAKTNIHALMGHAEGSDRENATDRASLFPQGGSTITQQLVRGYFLQKLTSTKNSNVLQHSGVLAHALAFVIGVPGANRFLLKVEEMRLALSGRGRDAEALRIQASSQRRTTRTLRQLHL